MNERQSRNGRTGRGQTVRGPGAPKITTTTQQPHRSGLILKNFIAGRDSDVEIKIRRRYQKSPASSAAENNGHETGPQHKYTSIIRNAHLTRSFFLRLCKFF